ncbi:lytic transglycosylase domain-containing protein [Streptomyces sp. TRM75563]|uniref:lytic transglycosylase domain-containing protein n=1 Tax=Streptomyces sp. TRM75563 TaxID=2817418 RepID=UPI001F60C538|nr:lytic transglycosylase domain-containing protein [Streptomyces sp. TRM75563]MCI4041153.1 lytic transglycosylase domain-containing protein [Streptomyces sp. TRM75563]
MRFDRTVRRRLSTTATAVAAMTALTASQAPGFALPEPRQEKAAASDDVVWTEVPGDDVYHTELPPLRSPKPPGPLKPGGKPDPVVVRAWSEAGIPATVLAAYRKAESAVGRSDPGCGLPWQLLAAIGKVESGQASGGRVDARGTTLSPILGPALDGNGFALIRDTDKGAYDGDRAFDRAVGPMQFIPSTWASWGADGNGDGRKDPNNIYDAALAVGHYLCAGPRDLDRQADLERAILSYNRSDTYLRTVLSWLEFYRTGSHPVADGEGVLPVSPGPGGKTRPKAPVGGPGAPERPGKGDGGVVVGPQPTRSPSPTPTPRPTGPGSPSPSPDPTDPGPDPTDPGPTEPGPSPSPDPTDPGPTEPGPSPSPDPTGPTTPPDPGGTDPGCPGDTPPPSPSDDAGTPEPGGSDEPCATPTGDPESAA